MDNEQIARLAQKFAEGDTSAFNELYRLTRNQAYFVALSITKSEDDALDMLQEAYLKAWQKRDSLKQPERFVSWFNRIVANTARDFLRVRKPLLFVESDEGEADLLDWQPEVEEGYIPHAAMDTAETRRLIMEIVDTLPEDLRLVTLLHYYDDMPLADIAAALDLPMSTVKARLRYARAKISKGVEDLEKRGTKLYGAAPIPLLIWLLRGAAAESAKKLPPVILGGAAAGAAAGGAVTGATIAGIAVPKLIAAVVAAAVIGGGATTGAVLHRRAKEPPAALPAAAAESIYHSQTAAAVMFPEPAFPLATTSAPAAEPQLQIAGSAGIQLPAGGGVLPAAAVTTAHPTTPPPIPPITIPPDRIPPLVVQPDIVSPDITTTVPTTPPAPVTFTVTYNYAQNGGSSATKANASAQKGTAADLSPTAAKPGWDFLGWNTDKDARSKLASYTVNGNTTLYAIFRKQVTATFVTIKWVNYGYGSGANDVYSETVSAWRYNNGNASIVSPGLETRAIKYYSSTTYAPIGWGLASDGADGRARFAPGATVSLADNETFYGIYTGGSAPMGFSDIDHLVTYNTVTVTTVYNMSQSGSTAKEFLLPITMPPAPPPQPGFTFVGWRLHNDIGGPCRRPGETVVPGAEGYYAVWEPI